MVTALVAAAAIEAGYIDPAACRPCHAALYDSYLRTGMGRSFASRAELKEATYYHRASNRHYRVLRRGEEWFLRRHQAGAAGAEINVLEKRIHFVIGSGNHARTFVHRTPQGRLVQLPLSWYAEGGGSWAMSPGYDHSTHLDFRRAITDECLFCHNGYPSKANGGLASGIDCQRCHGPGEQHARRPSRANIVNPARLSRERQLDVCMQCHLETASSGIVDSMRRLDRSPYSFRPGEPLTAFKVYFDHAPGTGHDDKFEINSSAYRLRRSRCFTESGGRMVCTTCHDPHTMARPEVRSVCGSCHRSEHAARVADCASCHIPKRRAEDAVHTVMTDHYIQRAAPARDLLAVRAESHTQYEGELVPYLPEKSSIDTAPYLAAAQIRLFNNPAALASAEGTLGAAGAGYVVFLFDLAEAQRRAGLMGSAIEAYRRVPESARSLAALGDALLRTGDTAQAVTMLEKARRLDPQSARVLQILGVAYGAAGRTERAVETLRQALRLDPDLPTAWVNLGVACESVGDRGNAEKAYVEAIRLQPDLAEARHKLATLQASK